MSLGWMSTGRPIIEMHGPGIIFLIGFFIVQFLITRDLVKIGSGPVYSIMGFHNIAILNNWYLRQSSSQIPLFVDWV